MTPSPGAHIGRDVTTFAVRAPLADALTLCLWRPRGWTETQIAMERRGELWIAELPGNLAGWRYGYRAHGEWAPERGLWFDPAKLLVDPHAVELDRRFQFDPSLSQYGVDTASLMPKARVVLPLPETARAAPRFRRAGLIYEVNVKAFTQLHPRIPRALRGTIGALAHPASIAHLRKLRVSAVQFMPIVAWIDERHLPPLGLANAWGYNPVAMMALDPGLCPGGVAELRETVSALHAAGIGVLLDLVLNHSGESDVLGPVLSLRALDNAAYAHEADGSLTNVTGCGNTLDFAYPPVRRLALDTLRHFVRHCGVDGFRFDLAPVLARGPAFDPDAPIFAEIAADPLLADRVMIAEPWDIGLGGYQLGNFPTGWLEWNDRYRDDVRRFWRGDAPVGELATRIAGSSDIFGEDCRSVSFVAAHDGFTLADTVSFAHRFNFANGEGNRDGHAGEVSWNNGTEGDSADPVVIAHRQADCRAMLATLFATTGTIMLTAGDEFGRTQKGNNNAYCQDNRLTWLDWSGRDEALEAFTASLAAWREERLAAFVAFPPDGNWRTLSGERMRAEDWQSSATPGVRFDLPAAGERGLRITVDRPAREVIFADRSGLAQSDPAAQHGAIPSTTENA